MGTVKTVKPSFATVDLGEDVTGLLLATQFSMEKVESIETVLKIDDKITVMIYGTNGKDSGIMLSTRYLEPTPGDMINNRQAVFDNAKEMAASFMKQKEAKSKITVGDVILATVTSVTPHNVYVDLGDGVPGLLHIAHFSREKMTSMEQLLHVDDRLKVMVLANTMTVKSSGKRLSASARRKAVRVSTKHLEKTPGDMINNRQAVFDNAEEMAAVFLTENNALTTLA
jgi:ribosomal protein S1